MGYQQIITPIDKLGLIMLTTYKEQFVILSMKFLPRKSFAGQTLSRTINISKQSPRLGGSVTNTSTTGTAQDRNNIGTASYYIGISLL